MAKAIQPVSINGLEFDALISESRTLEATAPTYPIETGFMISDSIILSPQTISMTLFLTNTPVTWIGKASPSRVQDVIKQLEDLYFAKTPVTIVTSEATYENYAIMSIELTKTKETGSSREIPITFQEIRLTESKTATMPDSYGKSGETGATAGTANITQSNTPAATTPITAISTSSETSSGTDSGGTDTSKGSILYNLANNSGLLGNGGGVDASAFAGLFGGN